MFRHSGTSKVLCTGWKRHRMMLGTISFELSQTLVLSFSASVTFLPLFSVLQRSRKKGERLKKRLEKRENT